eukprot:TRINITY_DN9046_c0_g1_i1.p1 TRINITY_DN9046_c0_g1~~TRINITY_DN9046_c0_g1_i1.p1  ORF type:complete len:357 (-),score=52.67 TRINITY_DN9046_c0_g1_i1:126-1160(-)
MMLINAFDFVEQTFDQLGRLHEGYRDDGALISLDTIDCAAKFKQYGHNILFFSYQWLSWSRSGPNMIQLDCMKDALEQVTAHNGIEWENLFVFLDILSIPQLNNTVKGLAVKSLYSYTRTADIMVVVAPESKHEDLGFVANTTTYKQRVWCRAEQASFCFIGNPSMMFLKEHMGKLPRVPPGWIDDVLRVFDGNMTCCTRKHPEAGPCDRESLVEPLIGMYFALMLESQDGKTINHADRDVAAIATLLANPDEYFPKTFKYVSKNGGQSDRVLFGDMISRVNRFLSTQPEKAKELLINRVEAAPSAPVRIVPHRASSSRITSKEVWHSAFPSQIDDECQEQFAI